jgi:putative protease
VGRVTNFFQKISVAEVLIEASPLHSGDEVVVLGETTGAVEIKDTQVFVADRPATVAAQGVYCSIKSPTLLRRGDKLYKIVENN